MPNKGEKDAKKMMPIKRTPLVPCTAFADKKRKKSTNVKVLKKEVNCNCYFQRKKDAKMMPIKRTQLMSCTTFADKKRKRNKY